MNLQSILADLQINNGKPVRRNNQGALRHMHGIPVAGCLLVIAPYHFLLTKQLPTLAGSCLVNSRRTLCSV